MALSMMVGEGEEPSENQCSSRQRRGVCVSQQVVTQSYVCVWLCRVTEWGGHDGRMISCDIFAA